jgi:hypothetical protein
MLHVVVGAGTSGVWLAVKDIDFRLEARGVEGLGERDVPPLITIDPPSSSVKACVTLFDKK